VIETQTEVKGGQLGMDLPVVLHDESDIALCGLGWESSSRIADAAVKVRGHRETSAATPILV
jgi:hypothetical protein